MLVSSLNVVDVKDIYLLAQGAKEDRHHQWISINSLQKCSGYGVSNIII
jgi:hypothetical protein